MTVRKTWTNDFLCNCINWAVSMKGHVEEITLNNEIAANEDKGGGVKAIWMQVRQERLKHWSGTFCDKKNECFCYRV